MERRILPSERESDALDEVQQILDDGAAEDPTCRASARLMFGRPAYELSRDHELPRLIAESLTRSRITAKIVGASFWADSAVLGQAGIPSVLFGPGGAGLHSTVEYVNVADVLVCRDTLVDLAHRFCSRGTW